MICCNSLRKYHAKNLKKKSFITKTPIFNPFTSVTFSSTSTNLCVHTHNYSHGTYMYACVTVTIKFCVIVWTCIHIQIIHFPYLRRHSGSGLDKKPTTTSNVRSQLHCTTWPWHLSCDQNIVMYNSISLAIIACMLAIYSLFVTCHVHERCTLYMQFIKFSPSEWKLLYT